MVSLGLVTHDHLEGKKNVISWFLSSLLHGHSKLEVQASKYICITCIWDVCTLDLSLCCASFLFPILHGHKSVAYAAEISGCEEIVCFGSRKEVCDNVAFGAAPVSEKLCHG